MLEISVSNVSSSANVQCCVLVMAPVSVGEMSTLVQ